MTTTIQHQRSYTWKERLKDSSWVTVAWDWFMTFLGRVVEGALWVTMVFSCYQLIPGAPQPASLISNLVFIIQFISLDVGGIGLNKLAQAQGLGTWSYTRIIAYILIGLTLITVAYAGLEHVVTSIPAQVTSGIEVSLVVARSVMTVLYGQAIHSLKHEIHRSETSLTALEQEVTRLRVHLDTEQQHASSLGVQVSSLRVQLDTKEQEVDTLRTRLYNTSDEASSLHEQVSSLRVQLDTKEQEVSRLREQLSSGCVQVDSGQTAGVSSRERVIVLDRRRAAKRTPPAGETHEQQEDLAQRIREVLDHEPGLSARAIAVRLGCSPTTASKWKARVEQEQQRTRAAGH